MIEKYTLPNGIPLFVVSTDAAPVVSVQAWVARGSIHETPALAGISHFLEHSLFKGTKKRGVGEIALEIEQRGGEINAFTSFEETVYYCNMASRYFADGLDIITDAVLNPTFDAQEMAREREVILEEIKRAFDSPQKMLSMNLWATAFPSLPYGRPVLGFPKTVSKMNHTHLRKYWQQNYHTGSLAMVVVGDIDGKQVFELSKAKLKSARIGKRLPTPKFNLPRIHQTKMKTLGRDVKECYAQIAWIAPPIHDRSIPSLDLICSAIGQGESSRLYQRLVKEEKLALNTQMSLVGTAGCSLATIGIQAAPENIVSAIREAYKTLQDTLENGLTAREMDRVKTSLEADTIEGKETVDGYARRLGFHYIQFNDPEYERKYLDQVLSVHRDEAIKALEPILALAPVISATHPTNHPMDQKAIKAIFDHPRTKATQTKKTKPTPSLLEKIDVKGHSFIFKKTSHLPMIALKILFPGGSREENKTQYGVSNLLQRTWVSGTPSFSSQEIAHRLESLGASIYAFVGRNSMGLSVEFLSKHWPSIRPILNEVLLKPTFPVDEFETEKHIQLREILSEKDSPGSLCQRNFLSQLYGEHSYGRSGLGSHDAVSKLKVSDIQSFFKSYVHTHKVVVSMVGDFDQQTWLEELKELTQKLPAVAKLPTDAKPVKAIQKTQVITEAKDPLFQTHIMAGFLGPTIHDSERFALRLLNSCLAGQGGRLFLELRDKQSLAYTVAPISSDSPEPGLFAFYIGCSPEKWSTALTGIRIEMDKILKKPISPKELARAKEYWLGRFELDMQRYSGQAMLYGLDELYGMGYRHHFDIPGYIKNITAAEIQKTAQKYLLPDRATLSIVHPEKLDEATVLKAWG